MTTGPGGRILTNAGVWSPDGEWIAFDARSEACVFSPDGKRIAYVRRVPSPERPSNQIFVATLETVAKAHWYLLRKPADAADRGHDRSTVAGQIPRDG